MFNDQMHKEWQRWQDFCQEFNDQIGDINDTRYARLVALIQIWGEELVRLRLEQDSAIRDSAYDEYQNKAAR